MKIVLSGVETNNKGAELMLYAILQAIEKKFPRAIVFIPGDRLFHRIDYISTNLDFRIFPLDKFERRLHLLSIFSKFNIPYRFLPHNLLLGKIDYYLDGSGFAISDKFNITDGLIKMWKSKLDNLYKQGSKIIFLPQAFGPFEKISTKKLFDVIIQYATLVMPREKVSLKYIEEAGFTNSEKIMMYTDFTSLVEGVLPQQYHNLRNGVCIIPNRQMINKGAITIDNYLDLLKSIILISKKSGRVVYILNHEGKKDEELCKELQSLIPDEIRSVSGLNALEVKGLISTAYLVVSSRFHGVASALNTCVPCLATSWSHKYEELFRDYDMNDCVLPLDDLALSLEKISDYMEKEKNQSIRNQLNKKVPFIKEEAKEMWETIWNL